MLGANRRVENWDRRASQSINAEAQKHRDRFQNIQCLITWKVLNDHFLANCSASIEDEVITEVERFVLIEENSADEKKLLTDIESQICIHMIEVHRWTFNNSFHETETWNGLFNDNKQTKCENIFIIQQNIRQCWFSFQCQNNIFETIAKLSKEYAKCLTRMSAVKNSTCDRNHFLVFPIPILSLNPSI